uniref:Glycosyltransferase family 92 protein n=1 Tax=Panagrolaimus superbus TaxID=310955 RepID=A0A914Y8C5_9BILA
MSETMPRFAYPIIPDCAWTTFIANCSTIVNPIKFQLSVDNVAIDLQLRPAVTETLPVVACFSPLFFNERWQLAAISIESYAAAGISRQIYYLMSAVKDVYDLLKLYEKEKLIDINLWSLPKHSEARIHLDWRNQAAAHTDCYLQYREAAQFIIISDIDDLLFPRKEFSFINELTIFFIIISKCFVLFLSTI